MAGRAFQIRRDNPADALPPLAKLDAALLGWDMASYTRTFVAEPGHIDELGHVNNAVWVQWIQQIATDHWFALASPEQQDAYIWVVTRHEIDYRGNILEGQNVTGHTWIDTAPKGARFDRCVRFTGPDGKVCVEARSTWALIDRQSRRLLRIPPALSGPFLDPDNHITG